MSYKSDVNTIFSLSPRVVSKLKTFSKFVSIQVFVQLLAALGGILLVRALSQKEYALFTIANSFQGTMSVLADSGISIGLTSIGGKVWQDRYRFGQLVSLAVSLRRYLAATAAMVVTPALVWLLISNNASTRYALIITSAVLVGVNYQLLSSVYLVVLRLHSQIERVQRLDFEMALARLLLLGLGYVIFLNAVVALLIAFVGLVVQALLFKHWSKDYIEPVTAVLEEDKNTILGIIKHQVPNSIFYCVQGQLSVWLISFFGNTQNVAAIGALGRISILFSVASAVMANIVLPSFARCQVPSLIRRRYFQILSGYFLFGFCLSALAGLFPSGLLWILGEKYAHLRTELFLIMIMAALNSIIATMWSLNSAKGWIQYSWLNIPGVVFIQALLLTWLDISSVVGVLLFSIITLLPTALLNATLTYRGFLIIERTKLLID